MAGTSDSDYHISKSYADVRSYLREVQKRVERGLFKVAERSEKNTPFMRQYNLVDRRRQQEMLLQLRPEDFLHAVMSRKEGNEGQELYVFVKKYPLYRMLEGLTEKWVYVKFDLIAGRSQIVIIVSFHEAEKVPESFPFQ